MAKRVVLGVYIHARDVHAPEVQKIFTDFGCNIKTRIGLHEVHVNACSPNGLILLEMYGDEESYDALQTALSKVNGVEVQRMEFAVGDTP